LLQSVSFDSWQWISRAAAFMFPWVWPFICFRNLLKRYSWKQTIVGHLVINLKPWQTRKCMFSDRRCNHHICSDCALALAGTTTYLYTVLVRHMLSFFNKVALIKKTFTLVYLRLVCSYMNKWVVLHSFVFSLWNIYCTGFICYFCNT
jgi:hypothetical protein